MKPLFDEVSVGIDDLGTTEFGAKTGDVAFRLAPDYADSGSGTESDPNVNACANAYAALPDGGGMIFAPGPAWYEETDWVIDTKPLLFTGSGRGVTQITDGGSTIAPIRAEMNPTGDKQDTLLWTGNYSIDANNSGSRGLEISGGQRQTHENIYITDTPSHAIRVADAVDITLKRIYSHGCGGAGLFVAGGNTTTLSVYESVFRVCNLDFIQARQITSQTRPSKDVSSRATTEREPGSTQSTHSILIRAGSRPTTRKTAGSQIFR